MIDERVRRIVGDHGKLSIVAGRSSTRIELDELGPTSLSAAQQLPHNLLNRKTFQGIGAMADMVNPQPRKATV